MDLRVVPPAVAAVVFALAASSPPVSMPRDAIRVDVVTSGATLLWRAAMDDLVDERLRAPRGVLSWRDDTGRSLARVTLREDGDGVWAHGAIELPPTLRHARAVWEGDGARLVGDVRRDAAGVETSRGLAARDGVLAADGALLPGVAGELLVRAPGAASVSVESELEGVTVTPAQGVPDASGYASFTVRVEALGLDAQVVTRDALGAATRRAVRLPLDPGGITLRGDARAITVTSASADGAVHVVGGDARGARWWRAIPLRAQGEVATASLVVPVGTQWVVAAKRPDLEGGCVRWLSDDRTPAAVWSAVTRPTPGWSQPCRALDGVASARARHARQTRAARAVGCVFLALALAVEAYWIVRAGVSRAPDALVEVENTARTRLLGVAVGVSLVMLTGFVLALAVVLHQG